MSNECNIHHSGRHAWRRWRTSALRAAWFSWVAFALCGMYLARPFAALAAGPPTAEGPESYGAYLDRVNRAFLDHLSTLGEEHALETAAIREGWETTYRHAAPESFIADAVARLDDRFGEALEAFDRGQFAKAREMFGALRTEDGPYVAANAVYFHVRSLIGLSMFVEAEEELGKLEPQLARVRAHTAYAPHLALIRAVAQAHDLRFEEADRTLEQSRSLLRAGPEMVRNGATQLRLEMERREQGTLGEVATVMEFVSDRLAVADATDRVQRRQQQVLDMLDRLIKEAQQREGQGGGAGRSSGFRRRIAGRNPSGGDRSSTPREQSEAPEGSGRIGDLHGSPRIDPGEMWGRLPPHERERILQVIRERYPSRYRQLVEQYYRSLAEEK